MPRCLGPMSGRTGRGLDDWEGGREGGGRQRGRRSRACSGEGGRGGKVEAGRARDAAPQREDRRGCTSSSVCRRPRCAVEQGRADPPQEQGLQIGFHLEPESNSQTAPRWTFRTTTNSELIACQNKRGFSFSRSWTAANLLQQVCLDRSGGQSSEQGVLCSGRRLSQLFPKRGL